jgi:hypothetical protein
MVARLHLIDREEGTMAETSVKASEQRDKLDDLLKRVGREPASDWGFTSEGEKLLWLVGKMADVFKVRAQLVFADAKQRVSARKDNRQGPRQAVSPKS